MSKRKGPAPRPPIDRFNDKVSKRLNGCWIWTARLTPRGYGRFTIDNKTVLAHRWAYEHFVGPIPDGLEIDHVCHTVDKSCPGGDSCPHRRCVNPSHLEPVTHLANVFRGRGGWNGGAKNRAKTHCPAGHPYAGDNLYIHGGRRHCRTCVRDAARRYYLRKTAEVGAP